MMNASGQLLQQNIQQLAKFLLIDDICNQPEKTKNQISKTPRLQDLKKSSETLFFNVGHFLNPFFMTLPDENQTQEICQQSIRNCVEYSKETQNLSILLRSVEELPKLRYQQSQKIFTCQKEEISKSPFKEQSNPKKINSQTFSQNYSTPNMTKTVRPTQQTPQNLSQKINTDPKKQGSKIIFHNAPNHKIIDLGQPSQQEQNDIEMNMSVKSHYEIHVTREDGQNYERQVSQQYSMKKNNHGCQHFKLSKYQAEKQRKVKEEKNMIQNYFESAKNRVFENCNLNCCEGMFALSQQQNYDSSSIQILQLKEESQRSKKQTKQK